jgi:hypothetical protein
MRRGRQAQVVRLSSEERKALEALVRQSTAAQRDVVRAKVALMADEGLTTTAIAASLGMLSVIAVNEPPMIGVYEPVWGGQTGMFTGLRIG